MVELGVLERYARQVRLSAIGREGQERISSSSVVIAGVGALGGFLAEYMVRAGVGRVVLVDRDVPSLVNLHRQIQFTEEDVRLGIPKAEAARIRLRVINSEIDIVAMVDDITSRNIESIIKDSNMVLDGTDNFETRLIINDACVKNSIPWMYGGVVGTSGMAMLVRPGEGPCFRCLIPEVPAGPNMHTCDQVGVLGPAVGLVASVQASTALMWLGSESGGASGGVADGAAELWSMDVGPMGFRRMVVKREKGCRCCGLREFDYLNDKSTSEIVSICGSNTVQITPAIAVEVNVEELAERLGTVYECSVVGPVVRVKVANLELIVFGNGRVLVIGTTEARVARGVVAEVLGL